MRCAHRATRTGGVSARSGDAPFCNREEKSRRAFTCNPIGPQLARSKANWGGQSWATPKSVTALLLQKFSDQISDGCHVVYPVDVTAITGDLMVFNRLAKLSKMLSRLLRILGKNQ